MLKLKEANCAIAAVLNHARDHGYCVSVTVCDPFGHLVAHQRMDGALRESSHYSVGKAIAAAGLGIPSGQVSDDDLRRSLVGRVIGSGAPINRRPGGLPIKRGGEVEAAIGVCGAPTDEQDEECARCGIEVLDSSAEKSRDSG
jgi:uncharacterized protein GlcG (DUF336 family)